MRFRVRVLAPGERLVDELIDAADATGARDQATLRGGTVLSVSRAEGWSAGRGGARFPLLLFNQELLALLAAGIPLYEAVETLAEKETREAVRTVLQSLLAGLREGRALSVGMEALPAAFPPLYVAMLRAAERTSDLPEALSRYIAYQQQIDVLRGKLVSAAIYPLLLLGVGGLVVLFLLGFVVPRFAHVYEDVQGDIPALSKLLIAAGTWIEAHGVVALAVLAVAVFLLVMALRRPEARQRIGLLAWRVPALGERLRVFELTRFYRTFGMLLRGGIPAMTALRMLDGLLSASLQGGLRHATAQVREGHSVSQALGEHGLATPVAARMLRVGERAGNLGEMLERTAAFHDEEIARWTEWLTRLFGPLLMLLIGGVIGLIVVLLYLPIFQLADSVG